MLHVSGGAYEEIVSHSVTVALIRYLNSVYFKSSFKQV